MKKILIKGGKKLKGNVVISGAKNSAIPIIAASLLTKNEVILRNVPACTDIFMLKDIIKNIGVKVIFKDNIMVINPVNINAYSALNSELATKIRSVNGMIGALLHRQNIVKVPLPGGCKIGTRKLDIHISSLTQLGVEVEVTKTHIITKYNKLNSGNISLPYPSVGVTENIMIATSLLEGKSKITNAAKEPEIVDLANFLNSMGADIKGAGTRVMTINGVDQLNGVDYTIIPDRIETGTYLVAAGITNGDIVLRNTNLKHLDRVVSILTKIGVEIKSENKDVQVASSEKLNPVNIITQPYPGFPTDMQPIITPLLSITNGESIIKETIFNNRFNHIPELRKMGAKIKITENVMVIQGPNKLKGAHVKALDLRSGGALVVAGLSADGETTIDGTSHIFRGYGDLLGKLKKLGAKCTLIT